MGVLTRLVALLVFASVPLDGDADLLSEPEAKAAVLYNLATYTTWPESRSSRPELLIGVAGPDPVLEALASVNGRQVQGRMIRVREIRPEDDPRGCDILYVPGTFPRTYSLLRSLQGTPVLTVGDTETARHGGAAVRVFFERSRLRLEIELESVERAQVRISSKVLSLARVLRNGHVVTNSSRP
jgi:hypothetical protein